MNKIIGQVTTIEMKATSNGEPIVFPSHTYNVIAIAKQTNNEHTFYVTDQEYKHGVPLIITDSLVKNINLYRRVELWNLQHNKSKTI